MAATSINCLAITLRELGWSYTRLIAELRRQAAIDGVVLPKTESLIPRISRWVNNHQQPDDFYRELLSQATGRQRFELFSVGQGRRGDHARQATPAILWPGSVCGITRSG